MVPFATLALALATALPHGFTRLDYVEATGTQFVDTGVRFESFDLVRDGTCCAGFVLGDMPDEAARTSAQSQIELFNSYVREVVGTTVPISSSAQFAIRVDLEPIADLPTRFDWRIDFPSRYEMRIRATTSSLFAALRQILEQGADARFLGVEKCMFQFEPRKSLQLFGLASRASARRAYTLHRGITYLPGHARALGFNADDLFQYSHGLAACAFPGDEYNAKGWPEAVMPVQNGAKLVRPPSLYSGWQPCYSNPEAAEIAADNIRAYLRAHPSTLSVTLGVNDNGGYCACDTCKAMDENAEKSLFSNDSANHSASYYTFVNRVAAAVAEEFPQVRFGLLAYIGTVMPPAFDLHPNVVPMVTCDLLAAGMDATVLAKQDEVIARWGAKAAALGTWDYCWGRGYCLPRVHFQNQAKRLKDLYAAGGRAYFGENSVMTDMLDGPKTYLTARLLENVDADPGKVLDDWYERFAGKAAAATLRGLFDKCRDYWLSAAMKKSPTYTGRSWVYLQPTDAHLYALTPGFTEGLLADARTVLAKAVTAGERRRAEILVRHFELLDCIAAFRGSAYVQPESGELADSSAAARMLNDFADRAPALMEAWTEASAYFQSADFEDPSVYLTRKAVPLDLASHFAVMFAKAVPFAGDVAVDAAFSRIREMPCLPDGIRNLVLLLIGGTGENLFSNPGFAKDLSVSTIRTEMPYRIDSSVTCEGGRTLRLEPGALKLTFVEDLARGTYLVTAKARTTLSGRKAELTAWRQLNGNDRDWETSAPVLLPQNDWRMMAKVRTLDDSVDGINLSLGFAGFTGSDACWVGDVRIHKIGEVASVRYGACDGAGITSRGTCRHETLSGEYAAAVQSTSAYDFAHRTLSLARILPQERLVLTVRGTRPSGSDGKMGVYIYKKADGEWAQNTNVLWNWQPPAGSYGEVQCWATGEDLGCKSGSFLIIFFHMKGTGPVGVSKLSWKVE